MSIDRMAPGYEPRFDLDYEVGTQGEFWVENIAAALQQDRVEVKTDMRAADTGNLYVEMACRGKPSGLAVTDSEVWVFVLNGPGLALAVSTDLLRRVVERYGKPGECARGSHPTTGYLVDIGALVREVRKAAA